MSCLKGEDRLYSKTNGQKASPGVKTPDSLRALKMERARAVRLGSLADKKYGCLYSTLYPRSSPGARKFGAVMLAVNCTHGAE